MLGLMAIFSCLERTHSKAELKSVNPSLGLPSQPLCRRVHGIRILVLVRVFVCVVKCAMSRKEVEMCVSSNAVLSNRIGFPEKGDTRSDEGESEKPASTKVLYGVVEEQWQQH